MFCVHCGVENPVFGKFCCNCGHALVTEAVLPKKKPAQLHVEASADADTAHGGVASGVASESRADVPAKNGTFPRGPHGVGGWLLLICMALTILNPLVFVVAKIYEYGHLNTTESSVPNAPSLYIVDTLLSLALAAYGVYTGIALWKVRPQAPITMRNFLLANLAFSIGQHFYYWAGEPFALALLGTALWLAYLRKSRRVRATWPNVSTLFWFEQPKPLG